MIPSLSLLLVILFVQPRRLLDILAARAQGCPMLSCPPRPQRAAPQPVTPAWAAAGGAQPVTPAWAAAGVLPSQGQHWAFLLIERIWI